MKFEVLVILILQLYIQITQQYNGVDIKDYISQENCQCFQSSGNSFIVVQAYEGSGIVNQNAAQSITNCQQSVENVGMEIYHVPCMGGVTAQDQVQQVKQSLEKIDFGKYWITVEYNSNSECAWDYKDLDKNCQFLQDLVEQVQLQFQDVVIGIRSQRIDWYNIFGDYNSCPLFTDLQLWYQNFNGLQNFDQYKQFGGWETPSVKQYQTNRSQCNKNVNLDWMP